MTLGTSCTSSSACIRKATFADRFALVRLGKEFYHASHLVGGNIPFDAVYAERTALQYIADEDKLCLVYIPKVEGEIYETPESTKVAQGMLLAHCIQHPMLPVKMSMELIWWISPNYRASVKVLFQFIKEYEHWAKFKGCKLIGLAHLGDNSLSHVFERLDYKLTESHYLKVV